MGGWVKRLVVDVGTDACRKLQKRKWENKVNKGISKDAFQNVNSNKKHGLYEVLFYLGNTENMVGKLYPKIGRQKKAE